jgi:benzoylformate decarboxylase
MDFMALACGQGCDAVHVSEAGQLAGVLREALASPRPILVEVDVA